MFAPRKQKLLRTIQCQRSRGLPYKNLNLPPTTAIDKHIIRVAVKRDSIHTSFSTIHIIYQTLKIAYSIPAAKLRHLIPPFFHFSEKYEVPSLKCIGFTGRLSLPLQPDQSLYHFSGKHEVPSLKCIGLTGRLCSPFQPDQSLSHFSEKRGSLSELHWFYGTPCQYILLTTFPERTIPLETPPTP